MEQEHGTGDHRPGEQRQVYFGVAIVQRPSAELRTDYRCRCQECEERRPRYENMGSRGSGTVQARVG